MTHHFEHVHIKSQDPRKTAQWWADVFGAKLLPEFGSGGTLFAPVEIGGVKINISSPGPADEAQMSEGDCTLHYGLEHIGIVTDDLDADLARLREQRLEIFEIRETPTMRIAFVETPQSVRVELMQRMG